ncbi:MAG: hypothetical protein R3D63_02190 [Paracoccaceae bacterium]
MKRGIVAFSLVSGMAWGGLPSGPALAQPTDYTTPEGAAFIHQSLGGAMLSFQNQGADDLIYFTNLLGWRCGTATIMYGFNDEAPAQLFPMEPCYREFRDPNVMQHMGEEGYPFFLTVPTGSVQKVTIRIVYEDGKLADIVSERAKNLMP